MREIEDKYDLPAVFAMPGLDGLPGVAAVTDAHEDRLEAIYYDTSDLRLARAKATLRRRVGGSDEGWHLKLPEGGDRREIVRPLGHGQQVPVDLRRLVLARSGGAALEPVARLQTTRVSRELMNGDGVPLATVVDDDVHAAALGKPGESAVLTSWREVEVELGTGDRKLMAAVGDRLTGAGATPSARASKLATVLSDKLSNWPQSATAPFEGGLRPESPAGEVIRAYLVEQFEQMRTYDIAVRLDDEEGIHNMRVATRRLRSTLGTFAAVLDAERAADLEGRLRELAAELGVVRDAEVLLARLLTELERQPAEDVLGPVADRIRQTLESQRLRGRTQLLKTLQAPGYLDLLAGLDDFLVSGIDLTKDGARPAKAVLPRLVARRYRKTSRRATQAARLTGSEQAAALHDTRKAAKQLRYAAEAVASAFGAPAKALARQAGMVQEVLGEHQDSIVAAQILRQMGIAANAAPNESAFMFGVLSGVERARGRAARHTFDDVWQEASRKRYGRWLKA